jgi:DNA-binding winged helix-turn-helix (wHTH) protein/tetratricopeptide (TPR) repeat protein
LRQVIEFPPFRLDADDERLCRDAQAVPLRPKTFAVLRHLAERPGRLVTKEEIFGAVWPGTTVTEDTLTKSIRELRIALGDDAREPRFIATVHGRGFRFIAPRASRAASAMFAGREDELRRLESCFASASDGRRQLVFVTGEAGIGKTALVDELVRRIDDAALVARGHCIEQHGAGEPYMPILDALAQVSAGPGRERLTAAVRHHAPAWLGELSIEPARTTSTPARMLRELGMALAALAADEPVVLVLEDLHWSDHGTVDALALLARRSEPARLLVVATVRPVDLLVHGHPLAAVKAELVRQGCASEILLELLSPDEVAALLAARLPGHRLPADFARLLHARTEGSPFLVLAALEHLVRRGALVEDGGRWAIAPDFGDVEAAVPDSVRGMIERQLEAVAPDDRELLEAAAVAGAEFASPAVAAATGRAVEDVEDRLAALARRAQLVEARGASRWPDGTPSARFRFIHALHRTVVYDRVAPGRRARLHLLVGQRLEAGHAERTGEVASELAAHFEQGGNTVRAVRYLGKAARRALRRSAPAEAARGFEKAIALAESSPETASERLMLALATADALQLARGYGSPEAAAAFERARALAVDAGDEPAQLMTLAGLFAFDLTRCRLAAARDDAVRIDDLVARVPVPGLPLMASTFAGMTRYLAGELTAARALFEDAMAAPIEQPPGVQTDFAVMCLSHLGCAMALLGFPDQARAIDGRARARARETGRHDEAGAAFCSAALAAIPRAPDAAEQAAADGIAITETHGFPMWLPSSRVVHGWAVAVGRRDAGGIDEMDAGIAGLDEVGFERDRTFHLMLLADALTTVGRVDDARATVDAALALAERTGERCSTAELWRLKGELAPRRQDAEDHLRRAIDVARGQEARWWELRATASLAARCPSPAASRALAAITGCFGEGFDTADLQATFRATSPGPRRPAPSKRATQRP